MTDQNATSIRANKSAGAVRAPLTYLVHDSPKPVTRMGGPGNETTRCEGEYAPVWVDIHDARQLEPQPSLERDGFQLCRQVTAVSDLYDDEQVRAVYYPEMERLVKEMTGAAKVVIFDHNARDESKLPTRRANASRPLYLVHNDFTADSGPNRARKLLPADEAEALLQGRFAFINVWRPIRGPMESAPLALCDAQSVAPGDLVEADLVYAERTGQEYRCTFNPEHRWCYFPRLERNEAILIKVCDTEKDGRSRFSLHTAFDDPTSPTGAAPRESIEVRCMAFFPEH